MDTMKGGHCSASNGALLVCWPRPLLERHGMLTFRKPLLLDESRGAMLQVLVSISRARLIRRCQDIPTFPHVLFLIWCSTDSRGCAGSSSAESWAICQCRCLCLVVLPSLRMTILAANGVSWKTKHARAGRTVTVRQAQQASFLAHMDADIQ